MAKNNKVCDFCLREPTGMFKRHEVLTDGHYICKNCKAIIQSYGLPVKYDLIVCNPPYLTLDEMLNLQKEVTFEPKLALYGRSLFN